MISIWDLVSFTAGLICFAILVLVGWSIIAGLIAGIMKAIKKHTKQIGGDPYLDKREQTAKTTEWQKRFVKEYHELRDRFTKLDMMIGKYEKGQLEFEPKCPIDLLKHQRSVMWEYLSILEQRARIEEIKL